MNKEEQKKKLGGMYFVLFIAYFVVNFHRYAGGITSPYLVEALSLTPVQVGLYGSIFTYCYAFANFPVGVLIDKFGSRKLIAFLYLISAIGAVLIGITNSFTVIIIGRILIAIGIAPVFAAASKAFAENLSAKEYTITNGWLQSFGRAGGVIAATPLGLLIVAVGWRNTYYLLAVVSVLIALGAILLIKEKKTPQDKPADASSATKKTGLLHGLGVLIKQKQYWLVLIYMVSLNATTVNIFANWGGVLLQKGLGYSADLSGNILLIGSVAASCGAVISGLISAKKSAKFAGYIGQTLLLLACMILGFFTTKLTVTLCYIAFIVIGLVEMYVIASGFTLLRTLATPKYVGTAFGFGNLVIWICGSSLVAQIWGSMVSADYALKSFRGPLIFHVVLVAVGLLCLFFVKEEPIAQLLEEGEKL